MKQDLLFAFRMLRKSPVFTLVAVLSLALGIGANAAIFQLLNAVRLKTLPVRSPEELVQVRIPNMEGARGSFENRYPPISNPIWEELKNHQEPFSSLSAWGNRTYNLAEGGEVRLASGLLVSGEFFNMLGVKPQLGRVLNANDDVKGCGSPGVVISTSFWQREYGGDSQIIGRSLSLEDHRFQIIGVTQPSFYGVEVGRNFDFAMPICSEALTEGKNSRLNSGTSWWLMALGRLKPGWSAKQATTALEAISPSLFQSTLPANYPTVNVKDYLGFKLEAVPAATGYSGLREDYEHSLWLLFAIAGFVLLIACANLANLLLARASIREREMAVRLAVGASRARLIRQLLAESLLLATVGTALGAVVAQFLSKALTGFLSNKLEKVFLDFAFDWRFLAFAAFVAITTCVLFGLAPALRATRVEAATAMRANGRGLTAGKERLTLRRALVVVQVSLTLVLVAGSVLFSRSLVKLGHVDTGFDQDGLLVASVGLSNLGMAPELRSDFNKQLLDQIKALPGVEQAAETNSIPLGRNSASNRVWMDGKDQQQSANVWFSWVGPSYFETLRTPLIAGRELDERDVATSPKVAIVNETFARQLIAGSNPVGQRLWRESTPKTPETSYEIVGVVKDAKYSDLREDSRPVAFLSTAQDSQMTGRAFIIRSNLKRGELTDAISKTLTGVNHAIEIRYDSFQELIDDLIVRDRLMATLSLFFGGLALLLSCIGLYGILSYAVATRTNELGIRIALGASSSSVISLILREAILLLFIGLLVGLPAIFALTRFASSLLFGLTPTDPTSLALAAVLLLVVTLLAALVPAIRATRIDPLEALRTE